MIDKIKMRAVVTLQPLVYVVAVHELLQQSDEHMQTLYAQPHDQDDQYDQYSDQADALLLDFCRSELYNEDDCLRIASAKMTDSPMQL